MTLSVAFAQGYSFLRRTPLTDPAVDTSRGRQTQLEQVGIGAIGRHQLGV